MIHIFTKRARLFVAGAALAGLSLGAGPAAAQYPQFREPVHDIYYYSDAAMTDEVGYEHETCNDWGVGTTGVFGTATNYQDKRIWAYCVNGQLEPYWGE